MRGAGRAGRACSPHCAAHAMGPPCLRDLQTTLCIRPLAPAPATIACRRCFAAAGAAAEAAVGGRPVGRFLPPPAQPRRCDTGRVPSQMVQCCRRQLRCRFMPLCSRRTSACWQHVAGSQIPFCLTIENALSHTADPLTAPAVADLVADFEAHLAGSREAAQRLRREVAAATAMLPQRC